MLAAVVSFVSYLYLFVCMACSLLMPKLHFQQFYVCFSRTSSANATINFIVWARMHRSSYAFRYESQHITFIWIFPHLTSNLIQAVQHCTRRFFSRSHFVFVVQKATHCIIASYEGERKWALPTVCRIYCSHTYRMEINGKGKKCRFFFLKLNFRMVWVWSHIHTHSSSQFGHSWIALT